MNRRSANPFSFKIDYAAAIAEDEARIAEYDSAEARAVSADLTTEELGWIASGYAIDAIFLAFRSEERAARLFGVTREDLVALAFVSFDGQGDEWEGRAFLPNHAAVDEALEAWKVDKNEATSAALKAAYAADDANRRGWKERGAPLLKHLAVVPVLPEEKRQGLVKHYKQSLARHRRNQKKYA